jgi:apolipoprotein N-acyltransferase
VSKPALANRIKNRPFALFWHLLAGAFASLSLPPLFLLPAIFALSIPLLAYLKAESRMQASMIFGAAGTGWFLASTYWVSHSLIVETPSLWGLAPFMALALSLRSGAFLGQRGNGFMVIWTATGGAPVLVCCIFQPW